MHFLGFEPLTYFLSKCRRKCI